MQCAGEDGEEEEWGSGREPCKAESLHSDHDGQRASPIDLTEEVEAGALSQLLCDFRVSSAQQATLISAPQSNLRHKIGHSQY